VHETWANASPEDSKGEAMKLKRIESGIYRTLDDKYEIHHWDVTAGNRKSWAVSDLQEDGSYDFCCEFLTLRDARRYLDGDKSVFILS
jgi:hypothetical protein